MYFFTPSLVCVAARRTAATDVVVCSFVFTNEEGTRFFVAAKAWRADKIVKIASNSERRSSESDIVLNDQGERNTESLDESADPLRAGSRLWRCVFSLSRRPVYQLLEAIAEEMHDRFVEARKAELERFFQEIPSLFQDCPSETREEHKAAIELLQNGLMDDFALSYSVFADRSIRLGQKAGKDSISRDTL